MITTHATVISYRFQLITCSIYLLHVIIRPAMCISCWLTRAIAFPFQSPGAINALWTYHWLSRNVGCHGNVGLTAQEAERHVSTRIWILFFITSTSYTAVIISAFSFRKCAYLLSLCKASRHGLVYGKGEFWGFITHNFSRILKTPENSHQHTTVLFPTCPCKPGGTQT